MLVKLRLSLPRRFLNVLHASGRAILWMCACCGWIVWKCLGLLWELLDILLTGGRHGKYVEKDFGLYYRTEHWKDIRLKAIKLSGYRCAVCGDRYLKHGRKLYVRHLVHERDGKSVRYREDAATDLVVLCDDHNQKGKKRVENVVSWRQAYKWYKFVH